MAVVTENGILATITANDLITRAYRLLGDISNSEALTADQANVGLEALNALLDSLSIQRLSIYEVRQESLTWPASTASRTIGDGADFDTHRPDRIESGTYFEDANNIAYQVDIVRNRSTYDAIYDKTVTSSYPELLMYVPSTQWGTLYVYPVPTASLTLKLNSWQPLQIFDTLTEAHILPAGYQRLIAYNLAIELEAEAQLPAPPSVVRIAAQALTAVKSNNNLPIYSQTDTSYVLNGRGRSDIVAGK
jgi:hypothetical protein